MSDKPTVEVVATIVAQQNTEPRTFGDGGKAWDFLIKIDGLIADATLFQSEQGARLIAGKVDQAIDLVLQERGEYQGRRQYTIRRAPGLWEPQVPTRGGKTWTPKTFEQLLSESIAEAMGREAGFSLAYAKDLAMAGKIEVAQITDLADLFLEWLRAHQRPLQNPPLVPTVASPSPPAQTNGQPVDEVVAWESIRSQLETADIGLGSMTKWAAQVLQRSLSLHDLPQLPADDLRRLEEALPALLAPWKS